MLVKVTEDLLGGCWPRRESSTFFWRRATFPSVYVNVEGNCSAPDPFTTGTWGSPTTGSCPRERALSTTTPLAIDYWRQAQPKYLWLLARQAPLFVSLVAAGG